MDEDQSSFELRANGWHERFSSGEMLTRSRTEEQVAAGDLTEQT
jgi:hypothetical protein